jgi:hypothetical protein
MLNDAGITPQEQEKNRKTIVEVMQFYQQEREQDSGDKVWEKMNLAAAAAASTAPPAAPETKKPAIPSRPAHTMSVYSTDIKKGTA